ncbi:MAG: peptidase [Pseudomonadota bacterium]
MSAVARSWIGTPFAHQGQLKGVGCDCLGLVLGVWAELGGKVACSLPAYTPDWDEPGRHEALWTACAAYLHPVHTPQLGDVLLFRMHARSVAKHLGFLAQGRRGDTLIHSVTRYGVVETSLAAPLRRRQVAAFRLPDLER